MRSPIRGLVDDDELHAARRQSLGQQHDVLAAALEHSPEDDDGDDQDTLSIRCDLTPGTGGPEVASGGGSVASLRLPRRVTSWEATRV